MFHINWLAKIRELSRSLSVRATAFAFIALIASFIAVFFSQFVPDSVAELLGGSASKDVIDILATSMLIVVTFSMSTLITTYSMITGTTTPRATKLVMEDSSAQNVLSTFLGAFIYSVLSLVSLSTKLYGPKGRVILFVITLIVIIIVIGTIIRWIGTLSSLGHLENLIKKIENEIEKSLRHRNIIFGWLNPRSDNYKDNGSAFTFQMKVYGHLQTIDMEKLEDIARKRKFDIYLEINVGDIIAPGTIIAFSSIAAAGDEDLRQEIESCFFVDNMRTFDEDPRYGIIALSELASRALSPGVNDPGSAIGVTRSLTRLIYRLTQLERKELKKVFPKPLESHEILDHAFSAISRDGSTNVEVLIAVQESFSFLSQLDSFKIPCREFSRASLERAKLSQIYPADYERIKAAAVIC